MVTVWAASSWFTGLMFGWNPQTGQGRVGVSVDYLPREPTWAPITATEANCSQIPAGSGWELARAFELVPDSLRVRYDTKPRIFNLGQVTRAAVRWAENNRATGPAEPTDVGYMIHVAPTGEVVDIRIAAGSGYGDLDESGREVFYQAKFMAGVRNGEPISMWITAWLLFTP